MLLNKLKKDIFGVGTLIQLSFLKLVWEEKKLNEKKTQLVYISLYIRKTKNLKKSKREKGEQEWQNSKFGNWFSILHDSGSRAKAGRCKSRNRSKRKRIWITYIFKRFPPSQRAHAKTTGHHNAFCTFGRDHFPLLGNVWFYNVPAQNQEKSPRKRKNRIEKRKR